MKSFRVSIKQSGGRNRGEVSFTVSMHFCLYFIIYLFIFIIIYFPLMDTRVNYTFIQTLCCSLAFPSSTLNAPWRPRTTVPVFSNSQIVQRALAPLPSIPHLLRHVLIPWLLIQYQCCRPTVFCILFGFMSIFVWHFGNHSVVLRC